MKHSDYHGKLLRLAMFFVALFLCGTMAYAQTDPDDQRYSCR